VTQRGERPHLAHAERIRVLSANLWNGGADPQAFADLVRRLDVDAVATQEMSPEQAEALAAVLPHGLLEPCRNYLGMGIALREPAQMSRVALPCRDARVAQISWPRPSGARLEIEIINIHVRAPHWRPFFLSWVHRSGQVRGLERYLDASPPRPLVLLGDFNATPRWPAYRRLATRLTDAAIASARRHGRIAQATWGPWPDSPRLLRIDHAMVRGLEVEDFQVVPMTGGDHCAIVVDLAVPVVGYESAGAPALDPPALQHAAR
jgi:endonuclease/exonuclease/phosphatase (EEP) superfamily protein YafD